MSNLRSFKIGSFRFAAFVPKRSDIIVFETKFWIETKRFQSVLSNFCPKAFVSGLFPNLFEKTKSFVLSLKNTGTI